MLHKPRLLVMVIIVLLLAACSPSPEATLPPQPSATLTDTSEPSPAATSSLLPTASPTETASPTPIPTPDYPVLTLEPINEVVRAYPGPEHYEGDLLTLEVKFADFIEENQGPVTLTLDNEDPYEVTVPWRGNRLLVPFDTTGLTGNHRLHIETEFEGASVDETYRFEVLPASERPTQEEDAEWAMREVACCNIHYITNTAAARDIDWIAAIVQEAAEEFDAYPNVDLTERIDIYLIDRMWGNGGFGGGGELLGVYFDRLYGPARSEAGLKTLVRHELGHSLEEVPFFRYSEGLSVYLAGGHYKPEPIPARGAALLKLGYLTPAGRPDAQHEAIYLHQAARIAYLIETYGWDQFWEYARADSGEPVSTPETQDAALQQTLGITLEEFNAGFIAWLREQEPGDQLDDLQLTVKLQNLRRDYQQLYAPEPQFILGFSEDYTRPEYVRVNIREPRAPANIAMELLIANGQQAIIDGEYDEAEILIEAVRSVMEEGGRLEHPLAREYGSIAYVLALNGYEAVSLDLSEDDAVVEATSDPPALETLTLQKVNGAWEGAGITAEMPDRPTPTAAPEVTATPDYTATPLPEDALYVDDFNDPESGWDRVQEERIIYEYVDGSYHIWINYSGATYWFDAGEPTTDMVVETTVTLQAGPEVNRFGVVCRSVEGESRRQIQFYIDGRGRYGIVYEEFPDVKAFLNGDGMQPHDAINPIGVPNTLKAVCDGSTLAFYVNGETLATVEDAPVYDGTAALILNLGGGAGIDLLYDYLLVTEP